MYLKPKGLPYEQTTDLEAVMGQLDVLYMTRVQRERFFNEEDYLRLKDSYVLTPEKMNLAKPDLSVLHPLPRVNEIAVAVDRDPRAAYWRQVRYGKFIRMALILMLLGIEAPVAADGTSSRTADGISSRTADGVSSRTASTDKTRTAEATAFRKVEGGEVESHEH